MRIIICRSHCRIHCRILHPEFRIRQSLLFNILCLQNFSCTALFAVTQWQESKISHLQIFIKQFSIDKMAPDHRFSHKIGQLLKAGILTLSLSLTPPTNPPARTPRCKKRTTNSPRKEIRPPQNHRLTHRRKPPSPSRNICLVSSRSLNLQIRKITMNRWDALLNCNFQPTDPGRIPPEKSGEALVFFHSRGVQGNLEVQLLHSRFRRGVSDISFCLYCGYTKWHTGVVEDSRPSHGVTFESLTNRDNKIMMGLAVENLQPLLTGGLSHDEV